MGFCLSFAVRAQLPVRLVPGAGSNSAPCPGRKILNHWTTEEVPRQILFKTIMIGVGAGGFGVGKRDWAQTEFQLKENWEFMAKEKGSEWETLRGNIRDQGGIPDKLT